MNKKSVLLAFAFFLIALFNLPPLAIADHHLHSDDDGYVTCDQIFETGAYQQQHGFTEGPFKLGCWAGQAIGAVVSIPVAAVYAPICSAADRGDCTTYRSPLQDGAELLGRVFGHTLGAPFSLIEMIFVGDQENSNE